jgi:hypothetical protein
MTARRSADSACCDREREMGAVGQHVIARDRHSRVRIALASIRWSKELQLPKAAEREEGEKRGQGIAAVARDIHESKSYVVE